MSGRNSALVILAFMYGSSSAIIGNGLGGLTVDLRTLGNSIDNLVYQREKFQVTKIIKTAHNTQIAFLKHTNGKKYLVKQETRMLLHRHMTVIRDTLGSEIARSAGVPANSVAIIPAQYEFPGKHSKEFPATLHQVVPGIRVDLLSPELVSHQLSIKQTLSPAKCGKQCGLTREVIKNMAHHPDLCRIAALDTFIANGDRHIGNFFYDPATDRYHAIDLESAFKRNSARHACALIGSMMLGSEADSLSQEELKALSIYRNVLRKLVQTYSPEGLHKRMLDLAQAGGFISRAGVLQSLERHRIMIKDNYESCEKLIVLLNTLLRRQRLHRASPVPVSQTLVL